jgi:hypothetical protein
MHADPSARCAECWGFTHESVESTLRITLSSRHRDQPAEKDDRIMQLKISETPSSTPWSVALARLASLEFQIEDSDKEGMLKRWLFGHELLKRRVKEKGRPLETPKALMTLTIEQCKISRQEINYRIQFAERYPTKKDVANAVGIYPSWHQMVKHGLVEKKRAKKPQVKKETKVHSIPFVLRKIKQELEKAWLRHATLTRDEIKDIEGVMTLCGKLLTQIDQNDAAKADRKIS